MLVSTTNEIAGYKVLSHIGMVRGVTVRSRSVIGNFAGGIQRATAQRDFKNTEQVHRHQRHESHEADEENGIAKLHAPTGLVTSRFDADDYGGEDEK